MIGTPFLLIAAAKSAVAPSIDVVVKSNAVKLNETTNKATGPLYCNTPGVGCKNIGVLSGLSSTLPAKGAPIRSAPGGVTKVKEIPPRQFASASRGVGKKLGSMPNRISPT